MNESPPLAAFGVHTLSEFVFCPRAGLLAATQPISADEPEDDDLARLDFLPRYSVAVIEEELAVRLRSLGAWGGRFLGLVIGIGIAFVLGWKFVALAESAVLFVVGLRLSRDMRAVLTLTDRRRLALSAQPREPDLPLSKQVTVNWWELLNAGFDSIKPQEIYRDEAGRVSGRPWRVLRKGSLRIPVIRIGIRNYEGGRYWIGPQHEARLTAYAYLLAVCEGGEVPYGVVLFGDSYEGAAVPITIRLQENYREQVAGLRRALADAGRGIHPPPPTDNRCAGCPLGKPEPVNRAARAPRSVAAVHGRTGRDGTLYHSACGDRFGWVPRHEDAKRKGLLPPGG